MNNAERIITGLVSEPEAIKVKIEWKDSYSVNVKLIDSQHKRLLKIINDLKDWADDDVPFSVLEHFIKLLTDYTVYHFTCEEKLMVEKSYPEIDDQRKEHNYFIDKLNGFKQRLNTDERLDIEMISFLVNWFIDHIQKKDKKIGNFLNSKGIS